MIENFSFLPKILLVHFSDKTTITNIAILIAHIKIHVELPLIVKTFSCSHSFFKVLKCFLNYNIFNFFFHKFSFLFFLVLKGASMDFGTHCFEKHSNIFFMQSSQKTSSRLINPFVLKLYFAKLLQP